jgi:2-oxoglutarate dehydrogenase E2 component (dihydrolipoamide succinyltransferase)
MTIEVKVPMLPDSVSDATVATWHKKAGDFVKRDENIVDIETDKVMLEVPATEDGILVEIKAPAGSTVTADQVLAVFEPGAAPATSATAPATAPATGVIASEAKQSTPATNDKTPAGSTISAGPSARRTTAAGGTPAPAEPGPSARRAMNANGPATAARKDERVPMTRLRQRIAQRLVEAQSNAAILTTFNEVNLKAVSDIRNRYKDQFFDKHGVKLGFMSFFLKASVEALKRFPLVNASIDGTDIVYHNYFDIGVAVSSERGLVVPIIRDADALSMAGLEQAIMDYAIKARDNKLSVEDMTGGTFTVSNGGTFGSLMSTPILNPPQSAILGMHKIEDRPVVENGEIVIRPMMYLAMSYDHRIIDGKESVTFLRTIKELLEDPTRLLLDL